MFPREEENWEPAGPKISTLPVSDSSVSDLPTLDFTLPACNTSPREADRAVSLPLPKATPSLEMFSRETERLSLIEKTGLLSSVFGFTVRVDWPDPNTTWLSPRKVSLRVPEVSLSVTKSPTTCVDPSILSPPGTKVRGPPPHHSGQGGQ